MSLLRFHRAFGWKATLALTVGTIAYIFVVAGLSAALGWPEAYGLQCHGRGCLLDQLSYTPALLRRGTALDYFLFAWIWLLPAVLIGLTIFAILDARRRSRGLVYPSRNSKSE